MVLKMKLKVKRTHPKAKLPMYASPGAACFDLYAAERLDDHDDYDVAVYDTGLAFEIPEGYAVKVYSRSGHGFKHGIRLANCVGIIDSDYRGSVMVKLTADSIEPPFFEVGERIAQAELVEVVSLEFEEVDQLSSTDRGAGGFGSTGND